jgi:xanthine dehydrogenase YagS FAD-binding subunit
VRTFEYACPVSIEEAADLAARDGARVLAGGTNLVDLMKLRVEEPSLLVDVRRLLDAGIAETEDGGIRIGAGARNSEIAAHPFVRERYSAVAQALLAGASGQLRNLATAGGNLLQRTRCLYFQDVTKPCNKREPGTGCSARDGEHRNLAILGASEHCIATHPSDFAVALAAFDATVVTSRRTLPLTELHRLPEDDPARDTVLEPGELITAIELPPTTLRSGYRKVRDRASFAFALVSVAAAFDGEHVRIALGGVAHKPWRARRAEDALRGAELNETTIHAAMELELREAQPLRGNGFKTALAQRAVAATLLELA